MTSHSTGLPPLQVSNLRSQALVALREAIVMGTFEPGMHLAEVRLAKELGISRGTLREALRQLEQEGLAVTDGRGRLHVRSLDARTVRDAFRVRAALETLAARTAAELPRSEKVTALSELERALEAMRAAEGESLHASLEADVEFHRTLCRVSGNESLLQSWEQISGVVRMSIMFAGAERARRNVAAPRHQEVIDLVAENPDDLEKRMNAHILDVLEDFELDQRDAGRLSTRP
ncbi:GntR family transcriptional regulator [Brachybacterium sp. GCM10030252]